MLYTDFVLLAGVHGSACQTFLLDLGFSCSQVQETLAKKQEEQVRLEQEERERQQKLKAATKVSAYCTALPIQMVVPVFRTVQ